MKKLMTIIFLSLLTLGNVSAESVTDVALEAKLQEAITKEIAKISKMSSIDEIVASISEGCETQISKAREAGADEKNLGVVSEDCEDKIKLISSLDVETAKAGMIAELQEMQSSKNLLFFMSISAAGCAAGETCYNGEEFFAYVLYPFALILDIVTLPVSFMISLMTGF